MPPSPGMDQFQEFLRWSRQRAIAVTSIIVQSTMLLQHKRDRTLVRKQCESQGKKGARDSDTLHLPHIEQLQQLFYTVP